MIFYYNKPDGFDRMTKAKLLSSFNDKINKLEQEYKREQEVGGKASNLFEDRIRFQLLAEGCDLKFYKNESEQYGPEKYFNLTPIPNLRGMHFAYMAFKKSDATPITIEEVK